MPAAVKTEEDEKKWKRARKKAAEQGHAEDWAYVMSIYKNMKGEKDSEKKDSIEKSAFLDGYLQKESKKSQPSIKTDRRKIKEQGRDSCLGDISMDMPYRDLNDSSVEYKELKK